jgi:hypothetical protein
MVELKKTPAAPFNGDAYMFHGWINSLQNKMYPLNLQAINKIDVYEAHTTGAPREVVQTFKIAYISNPNVALKTIEEKLQKRFGSVSEISSELRMRLQKFPEIRGSENDPSVALKLRRLSDICLIINAHMDTVEDLRTFNHASGLDPVRNKLPEFMTSKWRNSKANYFVRYHTHPTFHYFCDFLEGVADVLCSDVIHGASTQRTIPCQTRIRESTTLQTGSIVTSDESFSCPLHQVNSHELNHCELFTGLAFRVKRQFLTNYRLCFRCHGSHLAEDCDRNVKCDICNLDNHISAMHSNRDLSRGGNGPQRNDRSRNYPLRDRPPQDGVPLNTPPQGRPHSDLYRGVLHETEHLYVLQCVAPNMAEVVARLYLSTYLNRMMNLRHSELML